MYCSSIISIFTLCIKLKSLWGRYGLNYFKQEESYTSQVSILDRDQMPVYNADNSVPSKFLGNGLRTDGIRLVYGHLINANANGSLGIGLKKTSSSVLRGCLGSAQGSL